jgi:hypothetical protein
MAGRARAKALTDELTKRATRYFQPEPDEPQPSALDYVCSRVEGGTTTKALAQEISESTGLEVDYSMLLRHLSAQFGAQACDEAIDSARARASHFHVETALEIVDERQDDQAGVSRAASRARQRNWMAERQNRKQYGQDKGVSVSVSIGSLHLQALQAVPARATAIVTGSAQNALPAQVDTSVIEDADVVSE